jgi:hypothetical protein
VIIFASVVTGTEAYTLERNKARHKATLAWWRNQQNRWLHQFVLLWYLPILQICQEILDVLQIQRTGRVLMLHINQEAI